jgi:hypothetical protein
MRLDNDGWVSGQSGVDPNDLTTIDDTPDADTSMTVEATVATLRQVRSIHRKVIKVINQYIANADIKAKVNRDGPTSVNNTQLFNASRILNCIRFSKNADKTATVHTLVDRLNSLNDNQRFQVLSAIINGK